MSSVWSYHHTLNHKHIHMHTVQLYLERRHWVLKVHCKLVLFHAAKLKDHVIHWDHALCNGNGKGKYV